MLIYLVDFLKKERKKESNAYSRDNFYIIGII